MGKKGTWWDLRYFAVLLFMIDIVSSWSIGLRVNYSKEEIFPLVQLTLDQDSGKRPYEARQVMKTYKLKLYKELPSNIMEEDDSPDTNKNNEEVVAPISFATDEDSLDGDEIPSSLTTTALNASDETHNFNEKLPEDTQILLAAADGEHEAAIFGTIVGQLARPLDQLLGGHISSMVLALNQTASSSQQGGQQSGGSSGGSQSGGGQGSQQGSSGGSQNGGQQSGGGSGQGGGGGGTQGGGGGRENEEGQGGQGGGGGGQSGQGGGGGGQSGQGGGGGGQGGGGQVQCIPSRGLCTVFSARQCCPGQSCSVFPLGLLGPLSGPLSGPLGTLALGSCQPVAG